MKLRRILASVAALDCPHHKSRSRISQTGFGAGSKLMHIQDFAMRGGADNCESCMAQVGSGCFLSGWRSGLNFMQARLAATCKRRFVFLAKVEVRQGGLDALFGPFATSSGVLNRHDQHAYRGSGLQSTRTLAALSADGRVSHVAGNACPVSAATPSRCGALTPDRFPPIQESSGPMNLAQPVHLRLEGHPTNLE